MRPALLSSLALALVSACATAPPAPLIKTSGALSPGDHEAVIEGVRYWYRVAGAASPDAPPVVFLHGGPGGGSHTFAHFAGPHLEPGLRMVYLDQRGSGRSERPWNGDYALSTLVDDVERLRGHLGAPRISLLGHSFGAVLAMEYAARHPERVSRMVIAGGLSDASASCRSAADQLRRRSPAVYAKAFPEGLAAVADDSICDRGFRALPESEREPATLANMWPDAERLKLFRQVEADSGLRNTRELSNAVFRAGLLKYRFAQHDRLTMPVLVIAGLGDHQVGLEPQRALAKALPNGRLLKYEGAGHWMMVDQPARFGRDVTAFLNGAS